MNGIPFPCGRYLLYARRGMWFFLIEFVGLLSRNILTVCYGDQSDKADIIYEIAGKIVQVYYPTDTSHMVGGEGITSCSTIGDDHH